MELQKLTLSRIEARPLVLKLERPIVTRIATITDWPLILIDLYTEEGVVGRGAAVCPARRDARDRARLQQQRLVAQGPGGGGGRGGGAARRGWQDHANLILKSPYEVKDSELHIPDAPAMGLERDEKAVAAHLVDAV